MQPVNDDIDNLFRQAAENYPLNTQGADFDQLQQRMNATSEEMPPQKESRRQYGWLLLLLLLPFPFLCRHYYAPGAADKLLPAVVQQPTANPEQPAAVPNTGSDVSTLGSASFGDTQNTTATNTIIDSNSSKTPANLISTATPGNDAAPQAQNSGKERSALQENKTTSTIETSAATTKSVEKLPGSNRKFYAYTNTKRSDDYLRKKTNHSDSEDKEDKVGGNSSSSKEKELASGIALPATERSRQPDSLLKTDSARSFVDKNNDTVNIASAQKVTVKDSTATDSISTVKEQKDPGKKVKPFLYAGVIGGIDYSVVKSNQTAGTGYNAGAVAGYRFGKHWAIETGLLRAYKKYRSEGKYIDTAGLGIAGHTQVMNANGSCGILEIPLTVQYHFNSKGRSHWYAAAGLSSYLIKKEEYYYVGKRYNMVYYAEKEYTNSTKNWFSVLQLGGGYQWQLSKRGSLRAEPYIKLPLSKIGIAQLPLSSAGINMGYIISF